MKVTKKDRPYYAKWWFFISLLILGWLTPITKHWRVILFGENTFAYPFKVLNKYNYYSDAYIYSVNGKQYTARFETEYGRKDLPDKINVLYDPDDPKENITTQIEILYTDENLFFPVGLQIGLGVFFLALRFKDL
ncbi:MAG: hypothetical protein CMP61_03490 [Flavobacteriales bacterium]|nr:hypothetical protein [Flavobacteriales bacterium]|tara:strand:- start:1056 stop:1460 length:405 start_codon:yes stop_codon:yes gene_type:complete